LKNVKFKIMENKLTEIKVDIKTSVSTRKIDRITRKIERLTKALDELNDFKVNVEVVTIKRSKDKWWKFFK